MIKRNSSMFFGWLAVVVIVAGLTEPAYCRTTEDLALLLQQTPAQAGRISPEAGVHHFELNTEVTLTAVPRPGYQFVYWLGDVSDPTANSTVAYLDAPKIIIAVFERAEYEFLVEEGRVAGAGRGGLRASAADYARGGGGGAGGKRPSKFRWPSRPEEEPEPEPEDFPVPEPEEGEDDFPVPEIPEPTTVILLALGSLFAFGRRRTNKQS